MGGIVFFKSDLHFLDFLFLFLISLSFWVGSRYCILESLVVPLLNLNSWWRHSDSSCIQCTLRKSRWIQQFSQSCCYKHSFPFALLGKRNVSVSWWNRCTVCCNFRIIGTFFICFCSAMERFTAGCCLFIIYYIILISSAITPSMNSWSIFEMEFFIK